MDWVNMSKVMSRKRLEKKVGGLLLPHFYGEQANESSEFLLNEAGVAGVILFRWSNGLHNREQVTALCRGLREQREGAILAVDQEGGLVRRLQEGFTALPSMRELAHMSGEEAERLLRAAAQELADAGVTLNFAPVVDIDMDRGVMGDRTFGSDPDLVVESAERVIQAHEQVGIQTCLKHFPGHGGVVEDSHTHLPILEKSQEELFRSDLKPYQALGNRVGMVMTGHLLVPSIDDEKAASLSLETTHLLREGLGFHGVIVTDSLVMKAVCSDIEKLPKLAVDAFCAGADLLLLGGRTSLQGEVETQECDLEEVIAVRDALVGAVEQGKVSERRLDESLARVEQLTKDTPTAPIDFL